MNLLKSKISIIGLGYVGLPLAIEFGKKYQTTGFDINRNRIKELQNGIDQTQEVGSEDFKKAKKLEFSSTLKDIRDSNIYIITVPTPIDTDNQPDLHAVKAASLTVGSILKKDDIVIYESTVYPGLTEDVCVPILAQHSNLSPNIDFFYGYSPERIIPGDKQHRLTDIVKITSGSNEKTLDIINSLYSSIISAGTHKVSSIRVAESAKVIENIQRDVNIALVNELSIIFNSLDIDSEEVLEAAGTKWNFHQYKPGLVGGHCIGVDPHYLVYKAEEIGIYPKIINAGRDINEHMSNFVVNETLSLMLQKEIEPSKSKALLLGFAFKPNCPDSRNTKVIDLYHQLIKHDCKVDIYDPWNDKASVKKDYNIDLIKYPKEKSYDVVIIAVGHEEFRLMGLQTIKSFCKTKNVIFDLTYLFKEKEVDGRL